MADPRHPERDVRSTGEIALGSLLDESSRQVVHAVVDHQGGQVADDTTLVLFGWRL